MAWPITDADHLMVTAKQMENFESEILSSGFPIAALMEKIGQAMSDWLVRHSDLIEAGVVVLVGPGHNGGDGLVVARELHLAGVKVEIWCPFSVKKPLTAQHLSHVNWLGVKQLKNKPDVADEALWIDALFGLSQTRELPESIADLLEKRQLRRPGKMVSLDVPSGICSDSGKPIGGKAASASFTLTVGLIKQGLVQDVALSYVGRLIRIDLGLPLSIFDERHNQFPLRVKSSDLTSVSWPQPELIASKYQRGRVLVVAGSDRYLGAALLALKGAIASGVGSIQAAIPKEVAGSLWQVAPEIVLAGVLESSSKGAKVGSFLATQDLGRFDAVLIGPGLGKSGEHCLDDIEVVQTFDGLLVLDADALNRLAFSDEGWQWIKRRNGPTWITPHLFEFQRLFPSIKETSPLQSAMEAANLSGAGVLLKGAHSVIADPSGRAWQVVETEPCVARTGLGDLLAGFVTGVGALSIATSKGINCEVLAASAFVHAEAARRCKKGSSASSIFESLESSARSLQSRNLVFDPFLGVK